MNGNGNDDIIIEIGDVQINSQEFNTLADGMCVGDMIMHFLLRCLQKKYKERENFFYPFMPCTVQFIQTYPVEMTKSSFTDLNLGSYQYIFFPLSDFTAEKMAASHWSLLYIDNTKGDMQFKHFDSMNHSNIKPANDFVNIIQQIFDLKNLTIEELICNKQTNTYDCGIYVMAYIDALLRCQNHNDANQQLTPSLIDNYRRYLRNYILECSEIQKS